MAAKKKAKAKQRSKYNFDDTWTKRRLSGEDPDDPIDEPNVRKKFRWLAIRDKKICKGEFANACYPRHGSVLTYAEWKKIGLPGSRILTCSQAAKHCRCVLANPKATSDVTAPIQAEKAVARGRKRAEETAKRVYAGRSKSKPFKVTWFRPADGG